MERALAGEFKNQDLNEVIESEIHIWHFYDSTHDRIGESLHIFLGMTWDEYAQWAQYPQFLQNIIDNRKKVNNEKYSFRSA